MSDHIPREFIDTLLNRTDIVDLIDSRVTLKKKTGQNFFACCPFHTEKNASFSVSQSKQFFYCFGCGAHGNAIDFLMQFDRLNFPEAIETLAQQAGMEIPRTKTQHTPEKKINQQSLYDLLDQVTRFYQLQLRQHPDSAKVIEYLKQRGVSGSIAKDFAIGFAPVGWDHVLQQFAAQKNQLFETGMLIKKDEGGFYDRFRDRIMFPIHDSRGRIIGFGGRIIDQGEPKYLNSPETKIFQKGHELYGLYQAMQANRQLNSVLVVEGYMDVIALFQFGISYAVATLGTATSAKHLERLFRHTSEVIFCFDGDTAGRTAAWRALQVTLPIMQDGRQVKFMFLPDGEDPDTLIRKLGKEQFEILMQDSHTLSDVFFDGIAKQTDLTSTDGRARFVKLASDLLKTVPIGIFQTMMYEELAKKARIDPKQFFPESAPRSYKKTNPLKAKPPSTLRFALALLIQNPHLAQYITEPLPHIDLKGFDLFLTIVDQIHNAPEIKTSHLVERWCDQEEASTIAKLASWEHMLPEAGVQNEFLDAVKNLRKLAHEQLIENLLTKASHVGLSQEEKQHLTELITTK